MQSADKEVVMPFASKAQQRWMYANKPEMAAEWSEHTDFKKLPERVGDKKKKETKKASAVSKLAATLRLVREENPIDQLRSEGSPAAAAGLLAALTPAAALGGGLLGAARSPSVYGVQGAGRGALYGAGGSLGAALGAGLGGTAMGGSPGAIAAGALGGAGLGLLGTRLAMGKHPRDKDREATEERQRQKALEKAQAKAAAVEKLARFMKSAGPYEGVDSHAHYDYMPVAAKRELTPDEHKDIEKGKSRWIPKIFTSYKTKPHELMASPLKQGLIYSLLGGAGGAALGGLAGHALSGGGSLSDGTGAAGGAIAGGLGGAGLAGLVGGLSRKAKNEDIEELMTRLPPGATHRDLMSDPAYQTDLARHHDSNLGHSMIAASLANSMFR